MLAVEASQLALRHVQETLRQVEEIAVQTEADLGSRAEVRLQEGNLAQERGRAGTAGEGRCRAVRRRVAGTAVGKLVEQQAVVPTTY